MRGWLAKTLEQDADLNAQARGYVAGLRCAALVCDELARQARHQSQRPLDRSAQIKAEALERAAAFIREEEQRHG